MGLDLSVGSVDERAAKLLAGKVEVLKKKSAVSVIPSKVCSSAFGPGLTLTRVLAFSKFERK